MGQDKATLVLPGRATTMAHAAAATLAAVADPVVEVGAATAGIETISDPGEGPLVAISYGLAALPAGPVLALACDMPAVSVDLLRWLTDHPAPGSVVPVARGRPQPLCARWSAEACTEVAALVRRGERSMQALIATADVTLVDAEAWEAAFDDVDTPADVQRFRPRP